MLTLANMLSNILNLLSCFYLWSIRKRCYNVFRSNNGSIVWNVSFYFQWRLLNHFPYNWCCQGGSFLSDHFIRLKSYVSILVQALWLCSEKHCFKGFKGSSYYCFIFVRYIYNLIHCCFVFYCVTSVIVSSLLLRRVTSRGSSLLTHLFVFVSSALHCTSDDIVNILLNKMNL